MVALGIDVRGTAAAAARAHDGRVEACVLGEASTTAALADLAPPPDDATALTGDLLSAVAARAAGDDAVDAVAVTYPLAAGEVSAADVERAAVAAFGRPVLVARPVAIAARHRHGDGSGDRGDRGSELVAAVLDVDGTAVEVALVRCRARGYEIAGAAAVPAVDDDADIAAHLDTAVSAFEKAVAEAGLTVGGVDVLLVAGRSEWLSQLGVQATVATGLDVRVDPEPEVAAALGAALLAGGPERPGVQVVTADSPLLASALVPDVTAQPGDGGTARGPGGAGEPDGTGGTGGDPDPEDRGDVDDGAARGGGGTPTGQAFPGAAVPAARGTRRMAVAVAAALAATVAVVGVVGALGDGGGDGGGVETDGDSPEATPDGSSSTRPVGGTGTVPAGTASTTAVPSPATSTTLAPGELAVPPGTPVPGAPATGGGPAAPTTPGGPAPTTVATPADTTPPAVSGLARSEADISVDSGSELCLFGTTSLASAAVSDPSGIQSVTLSWSGNGPSGSAPMLLSGGTWWAAIGPVAPGELGGEADTLEWSVEAVDTAGNVSTSGGGPAVTVHGC